MAFSLESPAFSCRRRDPGKIRAGRKNFVPPLHWSGAPARTKSLDPCRGRSRRAFGNFSPLGRIDIDFRIGNREGWPPGICRRP